MIPPMNGVIDRLLCFKIAKYNENIKDDQLLRINALSNKGIEIGLMMNMILATIFLVLLSSDIPLVFYIILVIGAFTQLYKVVSTLLFTVKPNYYVTTIDIWLDSHLLIWYQWILYGFGYYVIGLYLSSNKSLQSGLTKPILSAEESNLVSDGVDSSSDSVLSVISSYVDSKELHYVSNNVHLIVTFLVYIPATIAASRVDFGISLKSKIFSAIVFLATVLPVKNNVMFLSLWRSIVRVVVSSIIYALMMLRNHNKKLGVPVIFQRDSDGYDRQSQQQEDDIDEENTGVYESHNRVALSIDKDIKLQTLQVYISLHYIFYGHMTVMMVYSFVYAAVMTYKAVKNYSVRRTSGLSLSSSSTVSSSSISNTIIPSNIGNLTASSSTMGYQYHQYHTNHQNGQVQPHSNVAYQYSSYPYYPNHNDDIGRYDEHDYTNFANTNRKSNESPPTERRGRHSTRRKQHSTISQVTNPGSVSTNNTTILDEPIDSNIITTTPPTITPVSSSITTSVTDSNKSLIFGSSDSD